MIWPDDELLLDCLNSGRSCKVGIMGGTFDPIHTGHLYCAEVAAKASNLDIVLFIPAGNPSFKRERELANYEDRLEMCKAAISPNPKFYVSDIESDSEKITYSVDTLRRLKSSCPENFEFVFIIGSDSLELLPKWREITELGKLCTFLCVMRLGYNDKEKLSPVCDELSAMGIRVDVVETKPLDISSSEIRARLGSGKSIKYIVPTAVCKIIYERKLYDAVGKFETRELD